MSQAGGATAASLMSNFLVRTIRRRGENSIEA
jgi:hypothetical protein